MSHINLLPWREKQREKQKQRYLASLAFVSVAALGIMYLVGTFVDQLISNQNQRNQYLQQQIAVLDVKIAKIKNIRESKQSLEQRIALIEQLQDSRNIAPQVIDELVKVAPNGIAFSSLKRTGRHIEVIGISESNNRLSEFMRRVETSNVFVDGELSSIVAAAGETADAGSEFKLTFNISPEVAPEFKPLTKKGENK